MAEPTMKPRSQREPSNHQVRHQTSGRGHRTSSKACLVETKIPGMHYLIALAGLPWVKVSLMLS